MEALNWLGQTVVLHDASRQLLWKEGRSVWGARLSVDRCGAPVLANFLLLWSYGAIVPSIDFRSRCFSTLFNGYYYFSSSKCNSKYISDHFENLLTSNFKSPLIIIDCYLKSFKLSYLLYNVGTHHFINIWVVSKKRCQERSES